jgi:hypothetical protein
MAFTLGATTLSVPTLLLATASVALLSISIWTILSLRGPAVPKGLRRPPSPPGARLFTGHSHLWNVNVTTRPDQTQLVKWSRELGEIYEIKLGTERWIVLSSPDAVRVGCFRRRIREWLRVLRKLTRISRRYLTDKVLKHRVDRECVWQWMCCLAAIVCCLWWVST